MWILPHNKSRVRWPDVGVAFVHETLFHKLFWRKKMQTIFSYDIFTLYKFPRLHFNWRHIYPPGKRSGARLSDETDSEHGNSWHGRKWTSKICRELKIDIFVLFHSRMRRITQNTKKLSLSSRTLMLSFVQVVWSASRAAWILIGPR